MERLTFKNCPLHHNDMVVRANRAEVIEDLFPEAAQAISCTERDVSLWAEAVIRYRHQTIRVVHHEIGEEHCGFDFEKTYGERGRDFIEVHHAVPVSELAAGQRLRMSDLRLLCSNCHRMVHRRQPWLSVARGPLGAHGLTN